MGLLAAMTGVWLTHGDNNVFTQIGLIVLVGLSAKNAILIVEFARELEFAGRTPVQAAIESSRLRLRPILMTSMAFVMGVVPLVLATGAGAEMRTAMGIAVFAGMIGVTAFGLFLTPVFYVLLRRLTGNRRCTSTALRRWSTPAPRRRAPPAPSPWINHEDHSRFAGALRASPPCWPRSCWPAVHRHPVTTPRAAPEAPASFKEADGRWAALQPAEAQPRGEWWKAFADPRLDDLITRADRNNTSIQLAASRVAEARALLRATDAERQPQVGLAAGAVRQTVTPGFGFRRAPRSPR
jgi:hypothetical protein